MAAHLEVAQRLRSVIAFTLVFAALLAGSAQAADPRAMPLNDFLAEVMMILKTQPTVTEVLVERVKPLRFAEQNGSEKYDAFFKSFNDAAPHPH